MKCDIFWQALWDSPVRQTPDAFGLECSTIVSHSRKSKLMVDWIQVCNKTWSVKLQVYTAVGAVLTSSYCSVVWCCLRTESPSVNRTAQAGWDCAWPCLTSAAMKREWGSAVCLLASPAKHTHKDNWTKPLCHKPKYNLLFSFEGLFTLPKTILS